MKKITTQEIELTAEDIVYLLKMWSEKNLPDTVDASVKITLDGVNGGKKLMPLDDVGTIVVRLEYEG